MDLSRVAELLGTDRDTAAAEPRERYCANDGRPIGGWGRGSARSRTPPPAG